jgi:hypothetical protein
MRKHSPVTSVKRNWGNNIDNRPLNYKYRVIFKFKSNGEKLYIYIYWKKVDWLLICKNKKNWEKKI